MATRNVSYDFFHLKIKNNPNALSDALTKEQAQRKMNSFNNINVYDYYSRIREIDTNYGIWIVNVEKINVLGVCLSNMNII